MPNQTGWNRLVRSSVALVLASVSAFIPRYSSAHPLQAEPVNHPLVIGFERFYAGSDDETYRSEGGFLLLEELNCVSCHQPPPDLTSRLSALPATRLDGVASRLSPIEIELFVRNPRFVKRDTTMPSLFAGPDRDLHEVAALSAWLKTLTADIPHRPVGDIQIGRALFHRIGCVACHAPEVGYRPPGLPEEVAIEPVALPNVPVDLADYYDLDTLTDFILRPTEYRPSSRMPDFALSEQDAIHLAAYLRSGPDLVLPQNLTEALSHDTPLTDQSLIEEGKQLFFRKNCHTCHEPPRGLSSPVVSVAIPALTALNPDSETGCFSARPIGGLVPFYGLVPAQKQAISAALRHLDTLRTLDAPAEMDYLMKRLNCYACHERGGSGGPEFAREAYFGYKVHPTEGMNSLDHLPPSLDGVGARLDEKTLAEFLFGPTSVPSSRPHLLVPMPHYTRPVAGQFLKFFPAVDRASAP